LKKHTELPPNTKGGRNPLTPGLKKVYTPFGGKREKEDSTQRKGKGEGKATHNHTQVLSNRRGAETWVDGGLKKNL